MEPGIGWYCLIFLKHFPFSGEIQCLTTMQYDPDNQRTTRLFWCLTIFPENNQTVGPPLRCSEGLIRADFAWFRLIPLVSDWFRLIPTDSDWFRLDSGCYRPDSDWFRWIPTGSDLIPTWFRPATTKQPNLSGKSSSLHHSQRFWVRTANLSETAHNAPTKQTKGVLGRL